MLDTNIQKQFRQIATVFLSHRRLGEAAALYRLIPYMHPSESNVKSVFGTTGWPESRYRFAKKVSDNTNDPRYAEDESVIEITDRKGLYREETTLLDYYQMRDPKTMLIRYALRKFPKNMIHIEKTVRIKSIRMKKNRALKKTTMRKILVEASRKILALI